MSFGRKISPDQAIQNLTKAHSDPGRGNGEAEGQGHSNAALDSRFEARLPKFKMDGVILPELVRQEIRILKSRINNHDLIYRDWGFGNIDPRGVNIAISFYGPPGTGKTMCAEGLASDLGKSILEINYAEIESN